MFLMTMTENYSIGYLQIFLGMPEAGDEDVMTDTLPTSLPTNSRRSRTREITDAEVEGLLSSGPAMVSCYIQKRRRYMTKVLNH